MNEYKERWQIESENMIKPGLEAMEEGLRRLGNPEKKLPVIHVTGTNGKGSTIAFMESILKAHGYSTGVFSSPAITDIHDQIRINGIPISEAALNKSFKKMKEAGLDGLLTDFELLTVAAFVTFEEYNLDYILLETGMGGLLDSTNVINPLVSVITSVAIDHAGFLGTTIQEVAEHKAGIIKNNRPVVTGPLSLDALRIVKRISENKDSLLKVFGETPFTYDEVLEIEGRKMKGAHQRINALVASEALELANIPLNIGKVEEGIIATELQYRFQEIAPRTYLDGAHNPAAAKALVESIRATFPGEKVDFVIGMLKGKDIKGTLDELIPVANSFTFLTYSHPDAASEVELLKYCQHDRKSVTKPINDTIILSKSNELGIIVTGSLYLLSGLKILFE